LILLTLKEEKSKDLQLNAASQPPLRDVGELASWRKASGDPRVSSIRGSAKPVLQNLCPSTYA
jgi:hypothetical protein